MLEDKLITFATLSELERTEIESSPHIDEQCMVSLFSDLLF